MLQARPLASDPLVTGVSLYLNGLDFGPGAFGQLFCNLQNSSVSRARWLSECEAGSDLSLLSHRRAPGV